MSVNRLLQIDSCLGTGSTGRITESIALLAQSQGWECYIVHGARYVKRPSCMMDFQSVSVAGEYMHYLEGLLFDNQGLSSRKATQRVVEFIKQIKPTIVHLHCIHGYYLNYQILFEYLNSTNIPVIWTFHDCWAFTGHCAHFIIEGCDKWLTGCYACPLKGDYPKSFVDCSKRNFELKKNLFTNNKNLHIVPVSDWLAELTSQSFFRSNKIQVIKNGVNLQIFKPVISAINSKVRVLGVSNIWSQGKGLYDFYRLRELLNSDVFEIVIVGLNKRQIKNLPQGIIGIERTDSIEELVRLYSSADVFVNPTYADTFPTVNIEALACGTPVLTYKTGGSPEIISKETGWVVEQGEVEKLAEVIKKIPLLDKTKLQLQRSACRTRAVLEFNQQNKYQEYLDLYYEIIDNK